MMSMRTMLRVRGAMRERWYAIGTATRMQTRVETMPSQIVLQMIEG